MSDPWLPVLERLSLSRAEQAAVSRYEQDPLGRGFLPVADILRSHKRIDESLELLAQGVERHPTFTVARVVLARELLSKGLVLQAWQVLEESPQSLNDNVLAQKIRFRLAVLLSQEKLAREIHKFMQKHQMLDKETAGLAEVLSLSGVAKTKDRLVADFRATGTTLILPSPDELQTEEPEQPKTAEPEILTGERPSDVVIESFHVVPLNEIFHGTEEDFATRVDGVELDSTTLADLFCKQGHYAKALAIYRRMLRITPNNDYLRRRLKEVTLLEKEQRREDLTVDPSMVDQMEALEIIDAQSQLFGRLLEKLNRYD